MKNPYPEPDCVLQPTASPIRYSRTAKYAREYRKKNLDKFNAAVARYRESEKGRATRKRYWSSEKGKAVRKRYTSSAKGKAAQAAWRKSERGRQAIQRYEAMNRDKRVQYNRGYRARPAVKERNREELRQRYAKHHALNLCPRCKREKVPGKSRCAVHLTYAAEWKRSKTEKLKALVDAATQPGERGSGA